jgi:hypothetical protein
VPGSSEVFRELEDPLQITTGIGAALDHGVDLYRAQSRPGGGIDAGKDVRDAEPGIGHGPEHRVVEGVQADRDPA